MAPAARQRRLSASTLQRSRFVLLVTLAGVVLLAHTRIHLPSFRSLFSPRRSPSSLSSSFLQQVVPLPLIHRPLTDYIQPGSDLPPALPPLLNPLAPHLSLQHHPFLHLLRRHPRPFRPGLLHDWLGAAAFFEWLCPELTGAGRDVAGRAGEGESGRNERRAEGGGEEEVSDDVRVVSGAWEEGGSGSSEGASMEGEEEEVVVVESRQRVCAAHLIREQQAEVHAGGVGVGGVGIGGIGMDGVGIGGAHGEEGSARDASSAGSSQSRGEAAEGAGSGEYLGYLPCMDGAYLELLDVLEAVLRSQQHAGEQQGAGEQGGLLLEERSGKQVAAAVGGERGGVEGGEGRFTVISAGPLLHTMTAFAAAHAYRQLHPSPSPSMALVVVHPAMSKQLQALARLNAVSHFTLVPLSLGGGEVQEREAGRWVTVRDVLIRVPRCDLLDVDADRAEKFAFDDPDAFSHVQAKVRRVQITTHGWDVHSKLEALFRLKGWLKAIDLPPATAPACHHPTRAFIRRPFPRLPVNGSSDQQQAHHSSLPTRVPRPECVTQTAWGPVILKVGLLSFLNPSFAHRDDVVRPPLTPL